MYTLYLFGCVQVFLFCEYMKMFESVDNRYDLCVITRMIWDVDEAAAANICGALHYHQNFEMFISNMFFMVLVVTFLTRKMNIKAGHVYYWIICILTVLLYLSLQRLKFFQFSIDSYATSSVYSNERVEMLIILFTGIAVVIVYQMLHRRVPYRLLAVPVAMYLLSFLYMTIEDSVKYHLHHAIVSGFLSYFVSDIWYLHAITIALVIQGINYHGPQTMILFRFGHPVPSPSNEFIVHLNMIWLIVFVVYGIWYRQRRRRPLAPYLRI